ncbi:hypothetical protein MTR_5g039100 [Medicago truncatula]|uniref:Uncharacterized protein n=1 Tax=Medicago truncatula TaxID=3880 RepID=G7KB69_MEDTR|nr:hypothetical protein MTR_5g039100 [Medicago truncatula]
MDTPNRDRDRNHHRSHHDSDDYRHHREDPEGSRNRDRGYDRDEREGNKGRYISKHYEEMEDSVKPQYSSHKRKDREHSEDRELDAKRIRVSEAKKERMRFWDKVRKENDYYDNEARGKEEVTNGDSKDKNDLLHNGVAVGSPAVVPAGGPKTSLAPPPSFLIRVSTTAGKLGSFSSSDALAKAKKALQMQKLLS